MASSKFFSAMALLPRALSSSAEAMLWEEGILEDGGGQENGGLEKVVVGIESNRSKEEICLRKGY